MQVHLRTERPCKRMWHTARTSSAPCWGVFLKRPRCRWQLGQQGAKRSSCRMCRCTLCRFLVVPVAFEACLACSSPGSCGIHIAVDRQEDLSNKADHLVRTKVCHRSKIILKTLGIPIRRLLSWTSLFRKNGSSSSLWYTKAGSHCIDQYHKSCYFGLTAPSF